MEEMISSITEKVRKKLALFFNKYFYQFPLKYLKNKCIYAKQK